MPKSTNAERLSLQRQRDKLRNFLKTDLKNWKQSPPNNNNQRDKMLDDHNEAIMALIRRLNILEGKTDSEDLQDVDPLNATDGTDPVSVNEGQVSPALTLRP